MEHSRSLKHATTSLPYPSANACINAPKPLPSPFNPTRNSIGRNSLPALTVQGLDLFVGTLHVITAQHRCDRKSPCNICLARNVADKCSYTHAPSSKDFKSSPENLPSLSPDQTKKEEDDEPLDQQPQRLDLSEQTGYSSRNDSNAFVHLQKSLNGATNLPNPNARPTGSMLVTYLKEKFCIIVAQLPADNIITGLLELFFDQANAHVKVVERYYFNKLFRLWRAMNDNISQRKKIEGASREILYFPALLFQVLAVAMQYLALDSPVASIMGLKAWSELDELSEKYSQLGLKIMTLLGRHSSTITSVQHDLVRAFWLKNCSRGTEAWYILGDAIRQAQDLGLHLQAEVVQSDDLEDTLERMWYDEYKRRLWVSLFSWDAHMALVLGRPRSINISDCTIKTPLNCTMPDYPSRVVPAITGPNDPPSDYTRHHFTYQLSLKTHEMLSLGADKRYVKNYAIVAKLHNDMLDLLGMLPPTVRPINTDFSLDAEFPFLRVQREHIMTAAQSFLIALHRPHAAVHEESRQAAIQAALATLESQQRLFELLTDAHYRTFGLSFYSLDSALFLSTAMIEHPPRDGILLDRIHRHIRNALTRLNIMKFRSPMAESGVQVLNRCYEAMQTRQIASHNVMAKLSEHIPSLEPVNNKTIDMSPYPQHGDISYSDGIPADSFDWMFANGNILDGSTNFDTIGNVTDFNASFYTEQMSQILSGDPMLQYDDLMWDFSVS